MRRMMLFLFVLISPSVLLAQQPIMLAEESKVGDEFRIAIALSITGKLKTTGAGGKSEEHALTATATHNYVEHILAADGQGIIGKAIRGYTTCESTAQLPTATTKRQLNKERRVIVVNKDTSGPLHYSTLGPLTRDELDVVAGQFDSMALPGLLPGKAVKVGESWAITPAVVQSICLFDGLTKHSLVGKLTDVKETIATFTVEGEAEGVEIGAIVKLKISLTGQFDLKAKRITKVTVVEEDNREQGPVAPACSVTAKLELSRLPLIEATAELTAADLATMPKTSTVPVNLVRLQYDDPNGKFTFLHARDWHVVAATKEQVVLRLVEGGEFVAQATVLKWKSVAAGQHSPVNEIKDAISRQPGWLAEKMIEDGEIPSDRGRWLYRLVAQGKQDDAEVQQGFHLLAGPNGDQIVMSVIARKDKADRIGTKDVELINAIEFPKK